MKILFIIVVLVQISLQQVYQKDSCDNFCKSSQVCCKKGDNQTTWCCKKVFQSCSSEGSCKLVAWPIIIIVCCILSGVGVCIGVAIKHRTRQQHLQEQDRLKLSAQQTTYQEQSKTLQQFDYTIKQEPIKMIGQSQFGIQGLFQSNQQYRKIE